MIRQLSKLKERSGATKAYVWIPAGILVVGTAIVAWLIFSPDAPSLPPITPEEQTARITAHLLKRKITRLRGYAVALQHREEVREILELALGHEITETDEKEIGTGALLDAEDNDEILQDDK